MSQFDSSKMKKRVRRVGRGLAACVIAGSVVGLAPPAQAATFTVNSTDDVNDATCDPTHCSLREAIIASNANAGTDTIGFSITGTGPHTIAPTSALSSITSPTVVDGTSEPDYTVGSPVVELDGVNRSTNAWNGLEVSAGQSTIKDLVINRFWSGIRLITANGNTVSGNFIGTNTQGTAAAGNANVGVYVESSSNNTIGGTTAADRNVISGNGKGVYIESIVGNNQVLGNYIGTNAAGTGAIGNSGGVEVEGDNNTIGGSSASARNVISGNSNSGGVRLDGTANGNSIAGNFIGVDVTGLIGLGNTGVGVSASGPGNTIGGTTAGAGNVISGNGVLDLGGVRLESFGPTGNTVVGNYIGLGSDGVTPIGNIGSGIRVTNSAGNTIGGTTPGARNIISANSSTGGFQAQGIDMTSAGATNNVVQGNFIGTDVTGTLDRGNSHRGIMLNSAPGNQIGGTASGAGNLISGNTWEGIGISSSNNTVQGNTIGTDPSGQSGLGNSLWGITIGTIGSGNQIGGTSGGAGNLISGNGAPGILSQGSNNTIQGNKIGTDASGQSPLGNSGGIEFLFGSNNLVGGQTAEAGNTIAFNTAFGVRVNGAANGSNGFGNSILRNSIFSNGSRGIELVGFSSNDNLDADAGPNGLQNHPVISSISPSGETSTVAGSLDSEASKTYRIELFRNAVCDPSGRGQGKTFLGSTDVTTNGSGSGSFTLNGISSLAPGDFVTATATDPVGNKLPAPGPAAVARPSQVITCSVQRNLQSACKPTPFLFIAPR